MLMAVYGLLYLNLTVLTEHMYLADRHLANNYGLNFSKLSRFMKTLLIALILFISISGRSQEAIRLPSGDYSAIGRKDTLIITGKVFIDRNGVRWPVFLTSRGKLYIIKQSRKTGKKYRSYLKL